MNKVKFDFGSMPVKDGYIKVTGETLYSEDNGFGIEKEAEAFYKDKGEKEVLRDYLLFSGNSFKAKLDNGTYNVRIYSGDYIDEGDVTTIYDINGVKGGFWVSDGCVMNRAHRVEVTDGFLNVSIAEGKHPCLNALDVAPVYEVPVMNVKCDVTAKADVQSVKFTWEKSEGAYGYRVMRKNLQNRELDKNIIVTDCEFVDKDVKLCESFEYTFAPVDDYEFDSKPTEPVRVDIVDGGAVCGAVENLSVNETETSITLTWDECADAVFYRVYQKAPYGKDKLVGETDKCVFFHDNIITNVSFTYSVCAVTTSGVSPKASIETEIIAKPLRRKMETLGRGLVAMKTEDGVFLSWRLNGWEYEKDIDFIVLRNGERITEYPITDSTNYLDKDGTADDEYTVKAVKDGKSERTGATTKVVNAPYISVPLDKPAPCTAKDGQVYEYHANDTAVADVDGDGEYEFVIKWVANGKDNSHKGHTGVTLLDAYKLDGTKLWRINLGINIREGAHYTQFMVYDFNNDGKAEMVCKTADGTIDGVGNVIGDINADYRNDDGFILDGPEYLTLFDGLTGAALDTVDYDPPRGNVREWGDSWGNRVDRYLACVAYLDGVNPSVVMCRGYYDHGCPTALVAYDVIDNKLVKRWKFLANSKQNIEYTNQGNHNLGVGDVDGDGLDEIVYGAMAVDHDGTGMYSTGLEHGDAMHLGKFTTKTPSLDFFQIHEHEGAEYGYEVRNPATGEISWGKYTGRDTTRGLCAKIDPRYDGNQVWVMDEELYTFDGQLITKNAPESINFAIWWDGDLLRELLDHEFIKDKWVGIPKIYKWNWETEQLDTVLSADDCYSNNGTKGNPCIQADILGDWREEAVWRSKDSTELRVYTTTDITNHKFYTLMHDDVYRLSVAWQNTAYNQPPHTGFYIGPEMEKPPVPKHDYVQGEIMPDFVDEI